MTNFGEFIKSKRVNLKLTLNEASGLSGISTAQISRLENGERGFPKLPTLQALSYAYGTPLEEFMQAVGYLNIDLVPDIELDDLRTENVQLREQVQHLKDAIQSLTKGW